MKAPLTDRQREALDFISSSVDEKGYPPTLREIGAAMGIRSTNGVNDHLKALERKGYLVRGNDYKSRTMRVVHRSARAAKPVSGWSLAGPLGSMLSVRMDEALVNGAIEHTVTVSLVAPEGVLTDVWAIADGMTRAQVATGIHAAALRLLAHELLEQQRLDGARVWIPHAPGGEPVYSPTESMWVWTKPASIK